MFTARYGLGLYLQIRGIFIFEVLRRNCPVMLSGERSDFSTVEPGL